ncbi:single-stranded DNA-binding protein [Virgibacillus oceani]
MLNRVVLVGRLTRDPDLRYTANGTAVANFTVASDRPFTNQQGERETDFVNCVTWRRQAENLANYMKKGSMIGVDGRVQTRRYDNQEGKTVFVTEILAENIQFLESKGSSQNRGGEEPSGFQQNRNQNQYQPNQNQNQSQNQNQNPSQNQNQENPFSSSGDPIDISDDDLPF